MSRLPDIGQSYEVEYPFVKDEQTDFIPDGEPFDPWSVGTRDQFRPPDDAEAVADGLGKMILTVIDIHKPGRFPIRIFYTRQWESPSGKRFGKGALRICTAPKFWRLVTGYGFDYVKPDGSQYYGTWGVA